MSPLDWILLVALLASVALGVWRGFVYEVLSVINWLLAFVLAQWLAADAGRLLPVNIESPQLQLMAGFVVVFVLAVFTGGILVWALPKLIARAGLQPVDRMLGGVFGLLRAGILMMALTVMVLMTPVKDQYWWRDSLVADALVTSLHTLKPVLPRSVGRYLP